MRCNQKDSVIRGTNNQSILPSCLTVSLIGYDDSLCHTAMMKNAKPKAASTGKRSGLTSNCRMISFSFVFIASNLIFMIESLRIVGLLSCLMTNLHKSGYKYRDNSMIIHTFANIISKMEVLHV